MEPQLGPGEKLHVSVPHDETLYRANELRRRVYVRGGKMPLRKKGQGRAIHVSDFIVEQTGRLALSDDQIRKNLNMPVQDQLKSTDSCRTIYPGKNHDGFWTNEKLVEQVSISLYVVELKVNAQTHQVKDTIPIFERMYPNAVAEFIFNQSSAHGAFAKDALNAKEMNVKPGGGQRLMHDTVIPMDNPCPELRGLPQTMVFPPDLPPGHPDFQLCG